MKTRIPVEKHDYKSCPCRPPCWKICPGSITVATRESLPHFQSFSNENKNLTKAFQTFAFWREGLAGRLNLQNLTFSGFGNQSNTNFESTTSTVSKIDTNQTHPISHFLRHITCMLNFNNGFINALFLPLVDVAVLTTIRYRQCCIGRAFEWLV